MISQTVQGLSRWQTNRHKPTARRDWKQYHIRTLSLSTSMCREYVNKLSLLFASRWHKSQNKHKLKYHGSEKLQTC